MKSKFFIFLLIMATALDAVAGDSLRIALNRQNFISGDTIQWSCNLEDFDDSYKLATLQVLIEDVKSAKSWQYRFPIVGKKGSGTIHISGNIPDGKYAFNFMLQKDFFSVRGRASYFPLKDTVVDYLMILKDKSSNIRSATLYSGGRFLINHLIFEDTASFIFSAANAYENFRVRVVTPLDSAFEPVAVLTKIVRISQMAIASSTLAIPTAPNYNFDYKARNGEHVLDNVVITAKRKKQVEEYADKYVSGAFKSISDMTFDGLENDEIGKSIDIFYFLQAHVAGLTFNTDNTGTRTPTWRGSNTDIYLDEVKMDADMISTINPEDVAIIKVFRPGSTPLTGGAGSGSGGAIAVYSKKGNFGQSATVNPDKQTKFSIRGYNSLEMDWQ